MASIGKKAQDWSYMTPLRPLFAQDTAIVDPSKVPQCAIIDMSTRAERAQHRTLVVHAVPKSGATLASPVSMYLWRENVWDAEDGSPCDDIGSSSSLDPAVSAELSIDDVDERQRWGLIDVTTRTHSAGSTAALAFVYPWLPAGRYIATIGAGVITGLVIIAEQHTE